MFEKLLLASVAILNIIKIKTLISTIVVKLGSPVAPGLGSPRSHKNYMPLVLLLGTLCTRSHCVQMFLKSASDSSEAKICRQA